MTSRIAAIVTVALLAGCAGGPAAGPSGSVAPMQSDARPAVKNTIPGQYKGSATDSQFGKGKATADLSKAGIGPSEASWFFNYSPNPVAGSASLNAKQNQLSGVFTLGPSARRPAVSTVFGHVRSVRIYARRNVYRKARLHRRKRVVQVQRRVLLRRWFASERYATRSSIGHRPEALLIQS